MGISIPKDIFGFKGQRVNEIKLDQEAKQLIIRCSRDRRRSAIDPVAGKQGTVIDMCADGSEICLCVACLASLISS